MTLTLVIHLQVGLDLPTLRLGSPSRVKDELLAEIILELGFSLTCAAFTLDTKESLFGLLGLMVTPRLDLPSPAGGDN